MVYLGEFIGYGLFDKKFFGKWIKESVYIFYYCNVLFNR